MSRPYQDAHGDMPDYYHYEQQRQHSSPQSRIPRPSQPAHHHPQNMRPEYSNSSPARAPRRPHQDYYPEEEHGWETSRHMYDGSGYEEDYGQYDSHYDQWPLPGHPYDPSQHPNVTPRRPPRRPQRPDESPQRPDYQQPVRDPPRSTPNVASGNSRYRAPPSSHHGNGQWTGDGYTYAPPAHPPPSHPPPDPRAQSPQFTTQQYAPQHVPQQAVYGHANRRPPLGPPPSARRGPISQYPEAGSVHPIVEETDSMRSSVRNASMHNSKTSFASSNAIPIGIPQVYLDNHTGPRPGTAEHSIPEDEDELSIEAATRHRLDRFADSLPATYQDNSEVMVRQASVGKKSKPKLTTVKTSDRMRKSSSSSDQQLAAVAATDPAMTASSDSLPTLAETERSRALAQDKLEGQAQPGAQSPSLDGRTNEQAQLRQAIAAAASTGTPEPANNSAGSRTPEEVLKSGTGLLDASSSESEGELKRKRSKELLGAALANELHPQRSRPRSPLAPKDDERVKSILDSLEKGGAISAEEAEELKKPTGGLSDRAGKRRPPRLNVDAVREAEARGSLTSLPDLIKRATKLASNLDRGKTASRLGMWFDGADDGEKRKSGNISDLLGAFPPPGSPGSRGDMRRSMMSSHLRHSALPSDSDANSQQKKRRCCGMPLWMFILLLLLLLILVAAAVVLPVVFVVLPNKNNNDGARQVGSCDGKLTCENGGANVLSSDGQNCECLCVNGYTGRTCSEFSEQGCTTTSIGSTTNVTIGNAIPRLLEGSQSNFSIPLNDQDLIGLFSRSDLSCVSQNALVTFNNAASKREEARLPIQLRQDGQSSTVTSDGIMFATGSPTPSNPATATLTSASAPTSSGSADSGTTLDFARVAVLYVFQASGDVNVASNAQLNLQEYFHGSRTDTGDTISAKNVTLGSGFTCDLTGHTVTLSNGTSIGGGTS